MVPVNWTPQAADDLEAICLFIARDSPQLAATFADRVLRATDRLAEFPRSGRIVPEMQIESIQEIIVASYRLIYRVRSGGVQLLTLHHGARMIEPQKIAPPE
jgi:plasmid stabilization system protein ParE